MQVDPDRFIFFASEEFDVGLGPVGVRALYVLEGEMVCSGKKAVIYGDTVIRQIQIGLSDGDEKTGRQNDGDQAEENAGSGPGSGITPERQKGKNQQDKREKTCDCDVQCFPLEQDSRLGMHPIRSPIELTSELTLPNRWNQVKTGTESFQN